MNEYDRQVLEGVLKALDGPKEIRDEDDWLERVQATARQIATPPAAVKRRQPKVARHQSTRQRMVSRQTNNPFRAGMMSAKEAKRAWERVADVNEDVTTRNVGPQDLPIRYTHGKETGYRSPRDH